MTRQDLPQAQADSGSLPPGPVGKESRLDGWTERVIDFFSRPGWLEGAVLLAAAGLYFYHAFNSPWPVGYAGLYTLMAEEIYLNQFRLPLEIPFYGPGGLPFAYPPLALYLQAFIVGVIKLPLFAYLRFAPAVFGLLYLAAAGYLIQRMTSSRYKALAGVCLVAAAGSIYGSHIPAAGAVRGLAMFWTLAGLAAAWDGFHTTVLTWRRFLLSGIFFGLTLLTHLSYAIFFLLSIAVMALTARRGRIMHSLAYAARAVLTGLLVAAPWWITVLNRYGFGVFQSAFTTHGTLGLLPRILTDFSALPGVAAEQIVNLGRTWVPAAFTGLALAGIAYALVRCRWTLLLWFFAVLFLLGESERFQNLVACIAIADLLVDMAVWHTQAPSSRPSSARLSAAAGVIILLGIVLVGGFKVVRADDPVLTFDTVEMGDWFQASTPGDVVYLFFSGDHDLGEWLPYLTRRTPAAAHWGSEWKGTYTQENDLMGRVWACAGEASLECLQKTFPTSAAEIDYLILQKNSSLAGQLDEDPAWTPVFQNSQYFVFQRTVG